MTTTAGDHKLRPRSGRTPLMPINSPVTPTSITKTNQKSKPKQVCIIKNQNQIPAAADLNKKEENEKTPDTNIEFLDTSLEEELIAIRKKLERLRFDKERTEKMLNERNKILDMQMKELQQRGEIQKTHEIEVDRLYRLNELKSYYLRLSSIRSLREKEQENIITETTNPQDLDGAAEEETVGENTLESPCSISSEIVIEKKL